MAKSNFFKILGKNILPILAGIILLCVLCNISYNNAFVEGFECVGKHVAKAKGGCEEKEECCKCRTSFTHASGNMNEEMKKVGCGEKGHPCAKICAYCGSWENPCKSKVASKKQAPSKASARGLRGYKCIPGFTTPAKIVGGEVACLSKNNKNCEWKGGYCDGDKVAKSIPSDIFSDRTALLCGPGHKKKWDKAGYDIPNHWCNKMKKALGFDKKKSPYYRAAGG